MKRKKPPVGLISVLVVAFFGLVIASRSFSFYNQSAEEQQNQLQKEQQERAQAHSSTPKESQKIDSKKEVDGMQGRLKALNKPRQVAAMDPGTSTLATSPTVVMPSDDNPKPTPNTAAPSSQWYDNK